MRFAFGLIALPTSRDKIGNFGDVASGFLIADYGAEMVPLRSFVSAVRAANIIRLHT